VTPKRAIGPIMRHKALNADLVRTIHGFDALLVLTGSTASANPARPVHGTAAQGQTALGNAERAAWRCLLLPAADGRAIDACLESQTRSLLSLEDRFSCSPDLRHRRPIPGTGVGHSNTFSTSQRAAANDSGAGGWPRARDSGRSARTSRRAAALRQYQGLLSRSARAPR
jgi:hypothetical protein